MRHQFPFGSSDNGTDHAGHCSFICKDFSRQCCQYLCKSTPTKIKYAQNWPILSRWSIRYSSKMVDNCPDGFTLQARCIVRRGSSSIYHHLSYWCHFNIQHACPPEVYWKPHFPLKNCDSEWSTGENIHIFFSTWYVITVCMSILAVCSYWPPFFSMPCIPTYWVATTVLNDTVDHFSLQDTENQCKQLLLLVYDYKCYHWTVTFGKVSNV